LRRLVLGIAWCWNRQHWAVFRIEELSAALLKSLIEKITIGEPQDVDGERIQGVKIYYKSIEYIKQDGHIC